MNPTVSVIIPTYNRAQLIAMAIDSVLAQTYKDLEIIVVDDSSTDNTEELVKGFIKRDNRIKYIKHDINKGGAEARNTGIKNARGDYVAFLDSDDMWVSEKLERQINIFEENDDIALVYSNFIRVNDAGEHIGLGIKPKTIISGFIFREILLRKVYVPLQTWIVRKDCFEEVGGFDTEFRTSHDRDMIVRIARQYKIFGVKEPLTLFRRHTITPRLRNVSTKRLEYYWFKFLDKLFSDTKDGLISDNIKKKMIADYRFTAGKGYFLEYNAKLARRRFFQSIKNNPYQPQTYIYLLLTLFGPNGLKYLINSRRVILQKLRSALKKGE